MKLNVVLEEMEQVLNEINEQFETIKKHEIRVPQIEIDILMSTMRKLYEDMSYLNRMSQGIPEEVPKEIIEKIVSSEFSAVETLPEENIDIVDQQLKEDALSYEQITNDFLKEINSLEETAKREAETEIEFEKPLESKKDRIENSSPKKTSNQKASLLFQFEDDIFTVNDSAAQKAEDKSVVTKLNNTRIENLKSAIGINDKFYFINELFKGNSQAYEDVIYTLNNFKRFEEAMQYVSTLKYRYDWNIEAEAYQKLIHFLERKFVEIHA
ncbi:MAG TPA: hypothetical protein DCG69_00835 [Bacteroidales bacterium]|nr:hypothetical protein [Bacteroidales bacterium]